MAHFSAKAIADQKFRDADSWRLAFELCAHRYQSWVLLWLTRRCAYATCMRSRRVPSNRLQHLASLIDEAHDFALTELDNMRASARNIAHAELAGRIYYEEYEEHQP